MQERRFHTSAETDVNVAKVINNIQKSMKVKFSPKEDEKLRTLVKSHGTSSWTFIAHLMGTRNHRQCRERWKNYINPALRSDPWTQEEDQLLVEKYEEYGSRWNKIAQHFENRSDNSIKNRWQLMLRHWERQKMAQNTNDQSEKQSEKQNESSSNKSEINIEKNSPIIVLPPHNL